MTAHSDHTNFIWQIADLLRGPYRPPQYERVMLPMTVLRRFDCVLEPTKEAVLAEYRKRKDGNLKDDALDSFLNNVADQQFHNHSDLTFAKLSGAPDSIAQDLVSYINSFSSNVRRIFEYFEFEKEIEKMNEANILYLIVSRFASIDLHPDQVKNIEMGQIFENLIRRFNELANETAGDHFTPREIITLMVDILFIEDDKLLSESGTVRTMLDPCCGTGGMLAEAQKYLNDPKEGRNLEARLYTYGQDYNKRAYATAASDMLIKQVAHNGKGDNIKFGDSLIDDQFKYDQFDYLISNPPFGVDWKKQRSQIKQEHDSQGFDGRFGAGLPRVNDGSLLFVQHMISKFEPFDPKNKKYGSRMAVVLSGSPLFTGGAGSGESDIRRWIVENDWLEAIIALPEQMFYNTGIGTYIWVLTNRKSSEREGKIQLIDARDIYISMPKNMGDKRRKIGEGEDAESPEPDQVSEIVQLYGKMKEGKKVKFFDNEYFGYTRVTVERPLRLRYQMTLDDKARFLDALPHLLDDIQVIDKALGRKPMYEWNEVEHQIKGILKQNSNKWKAREWKLFREVFTTVDLKAKPVRMNKKEYEADSNLRDYENIPLKRDIESYFVEEVKPHVPLAWMDRNKDKVGYEINFNRYFYEFTTPRPLEIIDQELENVESQILNLLKEVIR